MPRGEATRPDIQGTAPRETESGLLSSQESARELLVRGNGVGAFCGEDLDRNVVGTGVEVGAQAGGDRRGGAVQHKGVDETVAAPAPDVVVGVAVPTEVVRVVPQLEIRFRDEQAADGACDFGIRLEDDLVLGGDDNVRAEELTGGARVGGNHEIW